MPILIEDDAIRLYEQAVADVIDVRRTGRTMSAVYAPFSALPAQEQETYRAQARGEDVKPTAPIVEMSDTIP